MSPSSNGLGDAPWLACLTPREFTKVSRPGVHLGVLKEGAGLGVPLVHELLWHEPGSRSVPFTLRQARLAGSWWPWLGCSVLVGCFWGVSLLLSEVGLQCIHVDPDGAASSADFHRMGVTHAHYDPRSRVFGS